MRNFPVLLASLLLVAYAAPAAAELKICNQTDLQLRVAIGAHTAQASERICTKGWYVVKARRCETVVKEPLRYRYYWLAIAKVKQADRDSQTLKLCVHRSKRRFASCASGACKQRHLKAATFRRIDTGETGDTYTHRLINPEQSVQTITAHTAYRLERVAPAGTGCEQLIAPAETLEQACRPWLDRYQAANYRVYPHTLTAKSVRQSVTTLATKRCHVVGTAACTFKVK
jgi:uncharacterized membrane protein